MRRVETKKAAELEKFDGLTKWLIQSEMNF